MGARFELRHANWMLYLTLPRIDPPRANTSELFDFLAGLIYNDHGPTLFSSDSGWVAQIEDAVSKALEGLERGSTALEPKDIIRRLAALRRQLSTHERFGFVIGNRTEDDEVTAFAKHLAYETRTAALILIPYPLASEESVTVVDPYEALAPALEQRGRWPGFLVWTRNGESAFISMSDGTEKIRSALTDGERGQESPLAHTDFSPPAAASSARLLHLSDLHFGADTATKYEQLLLSAVHNEIEASSSVVISGDLFDQPREADYQLFKNFRAAIQRVSRRDPIVVPGNHDQRWLGNAPARLRQVADLEWSSLIKDDASRCIFFCFDSSRDATIAAGIVDNNQLVDIGAKYETLANMHPKIRDYLRIAVVHHHPFTFETETETTVQRFLGKFGLSDERFLRMKDADRFVDWLIRRDIPIVLHGHKHVQRHVEYRDRNSKSQTRGRTLTSIGCGTSLGAENLPLTYNVLTWDKRARSWTVSFFADPGDGSGFTRQRIAVHTIAS